MEISEGVMLMCVEPWHEKDFFCNEKDFFYKIRSLFDSIEILFAQDAKSKSEVWSCMKTNIQDMLSYDYVTTIRHKKQITPTESGAPVELGSQQLSIHELITVTYRST